jgi:hypothetical protein
MKYIKLSIVGLCFILMTTGCNAGKGHPGVGFIPKITDAIMVDVKDSTSPSSFTSGDQVTLSVKAEDQDQNMKTLWITEYSSADSKTPYDGPTLITLPKQNSEVITYSQIGPITLSGPTGNYRLDLQIEDTRGNKTDVFIINFSLEEL